MAEESNGRKVFTLFEVTRSIQKTIAERYRNSYWIKAEMNKLNFYRHSGHCYPELVEKSDGKVVAQIRCNLWKDDYTRIKANFERVLKEPVKDGIKILLLATIEFHPEHGLALRILDIDPEYTLGDLEREKQETIDRLKKEGAFNRNRSLELSVLPQRIAIISVHTSKGYADFLKVIESAEQTWGYKYVHFLFPALLQGDKAVTSIRAQLERIKKVKDHFDVVAIIRGGGGDIGLSCYNNYDLVKEIAMFPLPVLTGIGHATNETVAELVAFENAITPTRLAEFLVQKFHNFSVPVQEAIEKIMRWSSGLLADQKRRLLGEVKFFRSVTAAAVIQSKNDLQNVSRDLIRNTENIFREEKNFIGTLGEQITSGTHRIFSSAHKQLQQHGSGIRKDAGSRAKQENLLLVQLTQQMRKLGSIFLDRQSDALRNAEKNILNMSPASVLKRGFSITYVNGKAIRSSEEAGEHAELKTQLHEGTLISTVKSGNTSSI